MTTNNGYEFSPEDIALFEAIRQHNPELASKCNTQLAFIRHEETLRWEQLVAKIPESAP